MADDLNRWGFLIACGGRWDGKTIADIIRNPINIGYVRRGGVRSWPEDSIGGGPHDRRAVGGGRLPARHITQAHPSVRPSPCRTRWQMCSCTRGAAGPWPARFSPGAQAGGRGTTEWCTHPQSNRHERSMQDAVMETVVGLVADALLSVANDIDVLH